MMEETEGLRRLRARRRRFWGVVALCAVAGAPAGAFFGFRAGYESGGGTLAVPTAVTWIIMVASVAAIIYACWRYFREVDEVELTDNLWASLIGFYVYAIAFPAWWGLAFFDAAPPPNDWAIYAAAFLGACIAYGWRKLRAR